MVTTAVPQAYLPANSVTIIRPHPESHGQLVKLSAIDQIAPRVYMSMCLFFKLGRGTDKEQIFSFLHRALLRTVKDIPELACCVQNRTGNDREEVELLFDATKGIEVHYKDYESPEISHLWRHGTFDQLEEEHFPLSKIQRDLVYGPSHELDDNLRLPAFIVQANFIPGGLILGNLLHHIAGDGQSLFMLTSIMGAHLSAITDGLASVPYSPVNFGERDRMVQGDKATKLEDVHHWKRAEGATEFLNPTKYEAHETFAYAIFFISTEKLALLKSRFSEADPSVTFGTVETLSAFLWRHIVKARDIDACKYPEAKLSLTLNARACMKNPVVPPNFWGNFAEPNAVAQLPVSSLQQNFTPPLSPSESGLSSVCVEAARHVKQAIAKVDDKAVRRLVGLVNQMPKSTALTWDVDRYPGPDVLIVWLQGHRYNDIYFGEALGYSKALRATTGDTAGKPDGRCQVLPPRRTDGRGLEISLQYNHKTLKRLENDVEFAEYFVRRN